jgi:hypothetical protein
MGKPKKGFLINDIASAKTAYIRPPTVFEPINNVQTGHSTMYTVLGNGESNKNNNKIN